MGLTKNYALESVLLSKECFGQFGKIRKIVINRDQPYGQGARQTKTYTAYITFQNWQEAFLAILSTNGQELDGRTLKTTFGMTKYCQYFLSNQDCSNGDCLYLHELNETDQLSYSESNAGRQSSKDDQELIRRLLNDNFSVEDYKEENDVFDSTDFPSVEIALEKIADFQEN